MWSMGLRLWHLVLLSIHLPHLVLAAETYSVPAPFGPQNTEVNAAPSDSFNQAVRAGRDTMTWMINPVCFGSAVPDLDIKTFYTFPRNSDESRERRLGWSVEYTDKPYNHNDWRYTINIVSKEGIFYYVTAKYWDGTKEGGYGIRDGYTYPLQATYHMSFAFDQPKKSIIIYRGAFRKESKKDPSLKDIWTLSRMTQMFWKWYVTQRDVTKIKVSDLDTVIIEKPTSDTCVAVINKIRADKGTDPREPGQYAEYAYGADDMTLYYGLIGCGEGTVASHLILDHRDDFPSKFISSVAVWYTGYITNPTMGIYIFEYKYKTQDEVAAGLVPPEK